MLDNRTKMEGKKNSCLVNIQVDWQQEIKLVKFPILQQIMWP